MKNPWGFFILRLLVEYNLLATNMTQRCCWIYSALIVKRITTISGSHWNQQSRMWISECCSRRTICLLSRLQEKAGESRIRLRRIEWKQSEQNCPKIKKETQIPYDEKWFLRGIWSCISNHKKSFLIRVKTINKDTDPVDFVWWKMISQGYLKLYLKS